MVYLAACPLWLGPPPPLLSAMIKFSSMQFIMLTAYLAGLLSLSRSKMKASSACCASEAVSIRSWTIAA